MALNIWVQVFAWIQVFYFFGINTPNATAGLFDNYMLSFIRNGWTIFQIGYIILYSVQQCMDCLIFPHTAFSAITIFPFNQCKECIEIAHWGFNLQLLDSNWCYYLPWAYLPWQYCLYCNIYICLFPFLKFDFFFSFLTAEFWEFIICSRHNSFGRHEVCKYFISAWSFFLHTLKSKISNLMRYNLSIFSFMDHAFDIRFK